MFGSTNKAFAMVILSACAAEGQERADAAARKAWPYAAVGVATDLGSGCEASYMLHPALGVEALLAKGVGLGAEIGIVGRRNDCGTGVLSANLLYHPWRAKAPGWSPFVTGGGTLFAVEGGGGGGNLGVGVVRFIGRDLGLRLEVRAHFSDDGNFTEARLGVSY